MQRHRLAPTFSLATLLAPMAALLGACGSAEGPPSTSPSAPAVRRLRLGPAVALERGGDAEVLGEAVPDAETWAMESPGRTGVREVLGEPCALVEGLDAPKTVTVPAPEGASGFTGAVLELAGTNGEFEEVEVVPLRDGEPVASPETIRFMSSVGLRPYTIDFRRIAGEADALRVTFIGHSGLGLLRRAVFIREPLLGRLDLDSGADEWHMLEVGGVLRTGAHVASTAPVEGRFAAEPGDALGLFVAAAEGYVRPDERLTFTVTVEVEGRALRFVETVQEGEARRIEVPAEDLGSGEGIVRIEVDSNVSPGPAVGAVLEAALRARVEEPPTVLLITSDTHRGDHLGANAARPGLVRTPNIDRIARTGVLFEDCWAQTNITNPSHVSLMTGRHPRDTGVTDNRTRLARRAATLAERFAAAGYETRAAVSAFHLLDPTSGLGQGFDRMHGPARNPTDGEIAARLATEWLDESEGLPTFTWVHVFDAHGPYDPPAPFSRRYYGDGDPTIGPEPDYDLARLPLPQRDVRDPDFLRAEYRAEVDYLDSALRDLLERPRVEAGIVAFTSDHGESLGQHGIWWSHAGLYPDTIHVPLILRWPGGPAGIRVAGQVAQGDVAATLLTLAEVQRGGVGGSDLRAAMDGDRAASPHFTLASNAHAAAVRAGSWLCILTLRWVKPPHMDDARLTGQVELFDLASDPGTERDLVLEELEVAAELRAAILDWLARAPAVTMAEGPADLSAADEDVLRGLGYADEASGAGSGALFEPERFARGGGGWEESPWRRLFEEDGFGPDEFRAAAAAAAAAEGGGGR